MLSTSGSDKVDKTTQPLQSYEDIRRAQAPFTLSSDTKRLVWSLDGDLATSIHVARDGNCQEPYEPYFSEITTDDSADTWHPVSKSALTEPKISSVIVKVSLLEDWEDEWLECHRGCVEMDEEEYYKDDPMVTIGELPDYDSEEDEPGPRHLLRCCGSERPRGKNATLEVKAGVHLGEEFVTIHDYLSAVHPWLLDLKRDILEAMSVFENDPPPFETELMVAFARPDDLLIEEKAEWKQFWTSPQSTFIEKAIRVDGVRVL